MTAKWDAKKALKTLYSPPRTDFEFIEVPPLTYFMVDGEHGPDTPSYAEAVQALYAASYTLKFASKARGQDYVVPPLEALWWADDYSVFLARDKSRWLWTAMILIPPFVEAGMPEAAIETALAKKGLSGLSRVRVGELREGLSAQILHIGSYEDETPTLQRLHNEVLPGRGLTEAGEHHEIYFGDPRKTAPEKLKTILRQPVGPIA